MIIIKIMGGLASQLHKYAVAKSLSLKYDTELKLDLFWFDSIRKIDTSRELKLSYFNLDIENASRKEIDRLRPKNIICKITNKINRFLGKDLISYKTYSNKSSMTINYFNNLGNDLYLEGEWIGYKYFNNIKNILQNDFTLKSEYALRVNTFIQNINTNICYVSLHVRRGDFVHNKETSKLHCTCDIVYYKKAIKYLEETIGNFQILIFSDDLEWVKNSFDFLEDINHRYIENFEDYEEFYLMTQCKHNIIANSGFSWLSSWLNKNINKIVISPSKWVYDENLNNYIIDNIKDENIIFIENL
ncbi:alpha-1,2-fucosyltransferase [Arcobacter ellisii]|uniref:Alpha-1,2-fucosyltransferase n=1 Tax=Arcobacter ellisii TaxID=913109 RepID=A0A347UAL5_9BACT|nr:alpha-1,2-fucosyltransferase [Arcobacter ellisii]AXX95893.1 alpha-1,2-fucosyltransferase [Arcobacter ellisii]RXI29751.1 hypothetical protein CP962_10315 [Arcobacter ellisii]